jgi:hypothetical protein
MRLRFSAFFACLLLCSGLAIAADEAPLLATRPAINKTEIVFVYGGYLWSVPRDGGEARQLTHAARRSGVGKSCTRQLERLEPRMGERHHLFSFRSQRAGHNFCV